jgi:SAM-dependent methyltransferase
MATIYPGAEVHGLDIYPEEVLRSAKELMPGSARIDFVSGSIEDAPFTSAKFDLITAFDVLEHVPRPEIALLEINRLLSPTGILVASVPIESPVLRLARFVYLVGGRRGEIHPHWEGSFRSLGEFEDAWDKSFTNIERFNAPFPFAPRPMNYDVVFVGGRRNAAR